MGIKRFYTKPVILLFFSAVLSALPFTFSNAFALSWVSFVPAFYVIIKHSGDRLYQALLRGFIFGFIYHICIYYWFLWFYPLDYVNLTKGSSVAVVALAWFGISAVHGSLWCIPFVCCHFAQKIVKSKTFISVLAIVGIIAAQKLTQLGELSFPWTRISLGQYKATALIQSAAILGMDGTDIIILTINMLIALCVVFPPKRRVVTAVCALLIFGTNLTFGLIRLSTAPPGKEFTVMTVQASIPQDEKWDSDGDKICMDVYSSLTKENISDKVDLILWPESAVPKIYKNEKSLKQYQKLSNDFNAPILAGIILKSGKFNTNNTLLIDGNGLQASYTKRQLVPFGEYMPYAKTLSKLFPSLTSLNIIEEDYISGDSSAVMDINGNKIGNIICFESIYPHLARQSTLDGAQLLVEASNDSWLETSPAMYQHLAHGVFRSIENGRYLIRSANSGISAVIDSRGNIKSQLTINEQGAIIDTVQFIKKPTVYTKIGNALFPCLVVLTLIWLTILLIKKPKTVNR